jgi:hypothetical protein
MDWIEILQLFLTSITSVVVALIGAGYFKRYNDSKKESYSKSKLMEQIRKDEIVHIAIRDLRRKYNADRIYVWQFHNGGNFYTTYPMQKTSITYERVSDGLERKSERYQNMLISNFTSYIKQVIDGNMFYYDMDELEDLLIRSMCQQYGTQSHVALPVYDDKQHLIAILSLDWVFSDVPEEYLSEKQFNKLIREDLTKEANSLKNYI